MNINFNPKNVNYEIGDNKIIFNESPIVIKQEKSDTIKFNPNRIKAYYNIDLELHLRNQEVVAVPIYKKNTKLKLISNSIMYPIQGTHHNLYLTFETKDSNVDTIDFKLTLLLMSKNYWEHLIKKNAIGLMSSPISINIIS